MLKYIHLPRAKRERERENKQREREKEGGKEALGLACTSGIWPGPVVRKGLGQAARECTCRSI